MGVFSNRVLYIAIAGLSVLAVGCKKQQTTLQEDVVPPVVQEAPAVVPVDTSDNVSFEPIDLDAEFQRQVQENLRVLFFDYNSFSLTAESRQRLEVAGAFLMSHPNVRILIEGHCDERGSSEYNMALGENRARAVKSFINNYGVPSTQIEITSWGKERPVRSYCQDEGCHQENRRAEYKVLSK